MHEMGSKSTITEVGAKFTKKQQEQMKEKISTFYAFATGGDGK